MSSEPMVVLSLFLLGTILAPPVLAQDGGAPPEDARARARHLVDAYLAADSESGRASLLEEARALPYDILREAAAEIRAAPGAPTEPGRAHRFEVDVPVAGAPPAPYLVRLPPSPEYAIPPPVLVAMHHTGGTAEFMDQYWSATTDDLGVILVCPQATVNREQGWGSTEIERASILAVLRDVRLRFACDPDRIALTGMSMGGHATWEVGLLYPDQFAMLLPVCGGPRKETVPLVANLVDGPLVWQCQGALDQPALVRAVRMGTERLERAGGRLVYDEDPGRGHVYFPESRASRLAKLLSTPRPAAPTSLTYLTCGPPAGRHHWLRVEKVSDDAYQIGDAVELTFRTAPTEEEKFKKLWSTIKARLGRVEARIDRNKVLLETQRVDRLSLLLDAARFDPATNILVKAGGKTLWRGLPQPDPAVLLEELRRTGDRRRLVDILITVDLPRGKRGR